MCASKRVLGISRCLILAALVCSAMAFTVADSAAQFGLPKIKIPKIGGASQAVQAPKGPSPEVKSIKPDTAPPGWEGDVVFTGANFSKNMKLRLNCGEYKEEDFKIESAERAVLHLKISPRADETTCLIALAVPGGSDIDPSGGGTPEIVQVTGPSFAISGKSDLPVARSACLMGEGPIGKEDDMASRYEAYLQLQMEFQPKFMNDPDFVPGCEFFVSAEAIKYVEKGKVIFEKPASTLAKVEKFMMPTPMGEQSTDVFSITWKDGKIQNFMGFAKDDAPPSQAYDDLKAKLKK